MIDAFSDDENEMNNAALATMSSERRNIMKSKPNGHFKEFFYMANNHSTWPLMTAVNFLHHENSPTWAGFEAATLDVDGQRQTNYATQSALAELKGE
ncbi:hypothetical protein TNCV_2147321 [Trichonephila clavipes]|uniref:Uncharacterized protein n=1 Tax=Trichonephila clavipes TaxID=2585209 RepID=A0A8X6SU31_TRICX|nr:hypothetical protein TNCV_2147321 [Trichonephila clavipes]